MAEAEKFVLANGVEIPAIGFGTGVAWGLTRHPMRLAKRIVKNVAKSILVPGFRENNCYPVGKDIRKERNLKDVALAAYGDGCRLFDTARAYVYSENLLGDAFFHRGGVPRDEVFLITKASSLAQREGRIEEEFELSLENLRTDYADLYLLHWPQPDYYLNAWKAMERIYESGRARAIGICNAHPHHLDALAGIANIRPMVDELECHPLLQQWEVRAYCREHGIRLIAHTPTGKMREGIKNSVVLQGIANKHAVSVAQVILRWHHQLGDIPIPNTTSIEHVRQNLMIWDFELTEAEMEAIRGLDANRRIWPNPDTDDLTKW